MLTEKYDFRITDQMTIQIWIQIYGWKMMKHWH